LYSTDSAVPVGAAVSEITADQRGISRNNPPCAGAYEVKNGEVGARLIEPASQRSAPEILLSRDHRTLFLTTETGGTVELFTCTGRRILSFQVSGVSGMTVISLPARADGLVICRIRIPREPVTSFFLHF
jgi:hypothetical protein